jgi:electron transfer flavoprotein alpha subunit
VNRSPQDSGRAVLTRESGGPRPEAVAIVMAREGRLPVGADEAVAEAGGTAIVVGSGSEAGARALVGAGLVWWADTGEGFRPASLAARLAPIVQPVPLVVLPASPDGRDLAPRLAAALGRPLVAGVIRAACRHNPETQAYQVSATATRLDDRVLIPVEVEGQAVVTLVAGSRAAAPSDVEAVVEPLPHRDQPGPRGVRLLDPQVTAILEPDLHTIDLADASRVVGGGAGLVVGCDDDQATAVFDMLVEVAAAMGASAGATRVATDAGWTGYERQIGTTGITIDPELYIALGISGAIQHLGGLGTPRHIISVNTDAFCPMTARADLGLVTDARALLAELAGRFGVDMPDHGLAPPPQDRVGRPEVRGG